MQLTRQNDIRLTDTHPLTYSSTQSPFPSPPYISLSPLLKLWKHPSLFFFYLSPQIFEVQTFVSPYLCYISLNLFREPVPSLNSTYSLFPLLSSYTKNPSFSSIHPVCLLSNFKAQLFFFLLNFSKFSTLQYLFFLSF